MEVHHQKIHTNLCLRDFPGGKKAITLKKRRHEGVPEGIPRYKIGCLYWKHPSCIVEGGKKTITMGVKASNNKVRFHKKYSL